MDIEVRKTVISIEEIEHDGGARLDTPLLVGSAALVVANPYSGHYVDDILPMMEALKPTGLKTSQKLIDALGGDPKKIESYGKGAIVGEAGEIEHGALWHVPGGYAMRELLGEALAIVPSSKKMGGLGTRLDIPLTHINASYVRSHFSAIEVGVSDAPKAREIVFILAMATAGRPHARVGGLKASEISRHDGLR